MNAKVALAMALLRGEVVTIKTGFKNFGITNIPREITRCIEKPFNVEVSRTKREGKSRYKVPCYWYEYRLNRSEHNLEGIKIMEDYVQKNCEIPFITESSTKVDLSHAISQPEMCPSLQQKLF